jgi:hypothetical protein
VIARYVVPQSTGASSVMRAVFDSFMFSILI